MLGGVAGMAACSQTPETRPLAKSPPSYRLWCDALQGYYPAVPECPGGWKAQADRPQSNEATPPLLVIPVPAPTSENPGGNR